MGATIASPGLHAEGWRGGYQRWRDGGRWRRFVDVARRRAGVLRSPGAPAQPCSGRYQQAETEVRRNGGWPRLPVLVIGLSGAGHDTPISAAQSRFAGVDRFASPRRSARACARSPARVPHPFANGRAMLNRALDWQSPGPAVAELQRPHAARPRFTKLSAHCHPRRLGQAYARSSSRCPARSAGVSGREHSVWFEWRKGSSTS